MHVRFGSIFVGVISTIGLVEASNYTSPQAAGQAITSVSLNTASPEPGGRFTTSCNASCADTTTRPTYNSSIQWISISYTSGSHYPQSGPVVHSTVTDGLHPDPTSSGPVVHSTITDGLHPGPTTTEQAVGVVIESTIVGNDRITLPFLGLLGPRPTEQIQNSRSEPAVALPLTQSTETLHPGGPVVTHSGHTISHDSSTSKSVIDSNTDVTLHLLTETTLTHNAAPVLTLDHHPVSANSASEYTIGSQTLTPGGPAVTISGTRISLGPSASDIIIGPSTEALGPIITGGFRPSRTANSTRAGSANATATDAAPFTGGARPAKKFSSWGAATFLVIFRLVVG